VPVEYICQEQDCIASIAAVHGFPTSESIWEASDNSELRNIRKNPAVLMAGDIVRLPDVTPGSFTVHRGKVLRVVAKGPAVRLRVKLSEAWVDPKKTVDAKIRFDEGEYEPCKIESGLLDLKIPAATMAADLQLAIPGRGGRTLLHFRLGGLPPIGTDEGMRVRLLSLGYPCGVDPDAEKSAEPKSSTSSDDSAREGSDAPAEDDPLILCIQAFQRAEHVKDDEEPYGDVTRNKLREVCEEKFES
jgi:hypothetical protein